MGTRMNQFRLTALAAALMSACGGTALAQGVQGEASAGIGTWSNDRRQGGIYDGMRDDGGYLLLDADVRKRDDATGTWLGLKLRNFGLDSREIGVDWQRQGDIGASFEYSRIPRDSQLIINTAVTGIGTTTMRVPLPGIAPGAGWEQELGTVRDRSTFKFFKNFAPGLKLNISFRNEDKEGTRNWSRGGAAEFAAEPINSTTRQLEATLSYARERMQLSGGVYLTSYQNGHKFTDTARSDGSSRIFASLPLDATSWETFVNGGYNFTPATRGTFKASYSRVTQDEQSPFGSITGVTVTGPKNLGGRIDTTLLEGGITSRLSKELSLVANLRYRDLSDKTPVNQYVTAGGTDNMWNTPWSYSNTIGKLEATYRLPQGYSLLGGLEYNTQDRTVPNIGTTWVPFRTKLDEMSYRAELRKSMTETLNGRLAYSYSDRDGGDFTLTNQTGIFNNIMPLNIADRKRDKWRAMVDWSPADRINLQFALENSSDKYSGLPYGLQSGKGELYSIDGSYQISQDWSINAFLSRDVTSAKETTQRTSTITKYNSLSETGTSFGIGVRGAAMSSKLKLGGDVEQFRSVNKYQQDLSGVALDPATQIALPNITNKMLRLKLFAQYPIQKNADLRFNLIYEKWQTDDWSWLLFPNSGSIPFQYCGTSCTTTAPDGTTVFQKPKESSTFAGVRYIYKFE